jgi:hypothetical protein
MWRRLRRCGPPFILLLMPITVQVGRERVTVSDAGDLTCTCGTGTYCQHVEAVLCGDSTAVRPGSLPEALKLIAREVRIGALTKRLDAEQDPAKRGPLEAAIAQLLNDSGK